jgi:fumarylacetoacetase
VTPVIDETHDATLESWVESANASGCDFPIQNLPFGRFRRAGDRHWRIGVAIGNEVLDLREAGIIDHDDMALVMALAPADRRRLRGAISAGLRRGSAKRRQFESALLPHSEVALGVPCEIGDYTDFYVGIHHATSIGRQFRPDNPLLPNYKWVPIGYHGRASSINASGHAFPRPRGQVKAPDSQAPVLTPSARLDFELELALFVGEPNAQGEPVAIGCAEGHLFGVGLFNDWSARDIQGWEYQPLGPFLSKNFASTVSPWMVTIDALAPFRRAFRRPLGEPAPLPYLDSDANRESGAIDIELEVWLQTDSMQRAGHPGDCISRSNFADAAWWTAAQLVVHHTVNGCGLRTGDLLGSGTLSGPEADQAGSLVELSEGGRRPLLLSNGERRTFLEDGDTVILRGFCERAGFRRIGLGESRATVLPSRG